MEKKSYSGAGYSPSLLTAVGVSKACCNKHVSLSGFPKYSVNLTAIGNMHRDCLICHENASRASVKYSNRLVPHRNVLMAASEKCLFNLKVEEAEGSYMNGICTGHED